jgi:hypothetical protein
VDGSVTEVGVSLLERGAIKSIRILQWIFLEDRCGAMLSLAV